MTSLNHATRFVKPALCESCVYAQPIAPCEILPHGMPGSMTINGQEYAVSILGYLPPAPAEPHIDGYRLTKYTGESHDICLVSGRLECSCGDWLFRRSFQTDRALADCKHCLAVRRHFVAPDDQNPSLMQRRPCIAS